MYPRMGHSARVFYTAQVRHGAMFREKRKGDPKSDPLKRPKAAALKKAGTWLPPRVNGELQPSTVCQKITGPSLRMTSVNTWVSEVAA